MKLLLGLHFYLLSCLLHAQVIGIDTVHFNGSSTNYINYVLLGDGYTVSEMSKYQNDATAFKNYLFSVSPFAEYKNFINIFAIKVESKESGVSHPNTTSECPGPSHPTITVDNYFGSSFDISNIHRLVVPTKAGNISMVLANSFPSYDQVFILANSPFYGGSGGTFATFTLHQSAGEIATHEAGHSFAGLADEYFFRGREAPNMTANNNPSTIKWKNWLGINNVGIYPHVESPTWFRPHETCKMRSLGAPFCSVCKEAIVERIHDLSKLVLSYDPEFTALFAQDTPQIFSFSAVRPIPNTNKSTWKLNDKIIAADKTAITIEPSQLIIGKNNLLLEIHDSTTLVNNETHSVQHLEFIHWSIKKETTGTSIESKHTSFHLSLAPNPALDNINLQILSNNTHNLNIQILNSEGVKIGNPLSIQIQEGNNTVPVAVHSLLTGIYYMQLFIDNQNIKSLAFIKQ